MQPARLSTRLISGARILPRSLPITRPAVCSSRVQHRCYNRSARLHDRAFAFPVTLRDRASEDVPATNQTNDSTEDSSLQDEPTLGSFVESLDPEATWHPAYLRDMCKCPRCRDPSSTQKTFQTTDIPRDIKARDVEVGEDGSLTITWENDIPGFGPDHVSTFAVDVLHHHLSQRSRAEARFEPPNPRPWSRKTITRELQSITFEDYMKDEEALYRALFFLNLHGILLLKGIPESETAVEDITSRMGTLRDTFYGRTWDVKSVPEAKNVAYTHQYLGLHMDLLYMANPPGFQLLHCLKNTCEGGSSLFVDTLTAVSFLHPRRIKQLAENRIPYHYKNAGEHYYFEHPVLEMHQHDNRLVKHVNYSPPFQADLLNNAQQGYDNFSSFLASLRKFANLVEDPGLLYEYKMQEGECVVFNNRRVLHGRRQFDAAHGERWLKGAYVDTDVFMSRFRVLNEKYEMNGLEILEEFVEKDLGIDQPKPKVLKPINYGSPFKKKERKGPMKKKVAVDPVAKDELSS